MQSKSRQVCVGGRSWQGIKIEETWTDCSIRCGYYVKVITLESDPFLQLFLRTQPETKSWVIGVLNNDDVPSAISLLQSIKRTSSRLKSTAAVSNNVSLTAREQLRREFDHTFSVETSFSVNDRDAFVTNVILECFNTRIFGAFVYIDCESWVLKNIDFLAQTRGTKLNRLNGNGTILLLSYNQPTKMIPKSIDFVSEALSGFTPYSKLKAMAEIDSMSAWESTRIVSLRDYSNPNWSRKEVLSSNCQGSKDMDMKLFNLALSCCSEGVDKKVKTNKKPETGDVEFDSIAIVGMSLRFPGANDPDEFWTLLSEGRDAIINVPECRWNEKYCTMNGKVQDAQAGFLSFPVDEFDAQLFNMSPVEASYMDPQQRMVLELVWEAFEDAGISVTNLKGSQTGVFGGWWRNDYKEILQDAGDQQKSKFLRTYMGNTLGTATSRVSHVFGLTGPCVSTESGCSTSIVAVDMAVKSLQNKECSSAVAFGVNLFLHSFENTDFPTSVGAPDGRSKAFDARADGFGRAEGCGVLVLKRYEDALNSNDRIIGLIRGSAIVQDGMSSSLGTPTVDGEALAMELALERACVNPEDVEFLESHGTGTPVGDPLEMAAIAKAYGCAGRKKPLIVGSVKTNIGHTESTSGIAGIIKTLLSMKHELIPKHVNFESLNPYVNLEAVPAVLPLENLEWKKHASGRPRFAGVSSFGITGTNAHVILQEPPQKDYECLSTNESDKTILHILKMSASSQNALCDLKQRYVNYLEANNTPEIRDFTYSCNTGRADLTHRVFAVGSSKDELIQGINRAVSPSWKSDTQKVCFLFTGQGSQYVSMSKELYNFHRIFACSMDLCLNYLQEHFALNLREVMWGGCNETLNQTKYSQPGIFCVEYCLLKLWESWGIQPDCVLGHSLGEFAAAVAAGIISVEEALTLVATRSILIDKLENGSMLVVKGNQKLVSSLIDVLPGTRQNELDIAAMNTEDQTVVAGTKEAINCLKELCMSRNVKSSLLKATHAFHSKMMDPMLEEYMETAQKIQHKLPRCTFVSGMEGRVLNPLTPEYWKHHTSKSVNFLQATSTVLEEVGCNIFLEVGPQPILSSFILENKTGTAAITCFPSLRKSEDDWMTMLTTLGSLYQRNISVDWDGFHRFWGGSKVPVPFYPFQHKQITFPEESVNDFYPSTHPLVGSQVSNLSETKIFQKILRLDDQEFLREHVVGSLILCPGAAFLEMCLVSGYAGTQCLEGSFQTPLYPICLEKFQIHMPLALDNRGHTKFQSTVTEKDNQTVVSIGSQVTLEDGTRKWNQHASGTFLPFENIEKHVSDSTMTGLSQLRDRFNEKADIDTLYDDLAEAGLKFGPSFRTIKRVWKNSTNQEEDFVELEIKRDGKDHLLHPVVIDAMIQSSMCVKSSGQKKVTLTVPISVEKFIWYKTLKTSTCFVHVRNISLDPISPKITQTCVILFDAEGEKIAMMIEPTLIDTTLSAIMKSVEVNKNALPPMYEDIWRSQIAPHSGRIQNNKIQLCDDNLNTSISCNLLSGANLELYEEFNRLNLLYLIICLRELGFEFDSSTKPFQLDEVLSSLKVSPRFSSFVFYILMELLDEKYISTMQEGSLSHESKFYFVSPLPTLFEAQKLEKDLLRLPILQNKQDVIDVGALGKKLSLILSGSVSGLAILFPESREGDKSGEMITSPAESYYKTSQFAADTLLTTKRIFRSIMNQVDELKKENTDSICRVLEIGAGTGSVTEMLVDFLPKDHVEYTYTDISPIFFINGENIFKDVTGLQTVYKTLNIEEDPMSQGFIPQHFDFIVGGYVVHATKDLKNTLRKLRTLLAPNGTLVLLELSKPMRSINILFGTLDGFSSFTDYDLRPFNCELPSSQWEALLGQCGYGDTRIFTAHNDHGAIIVSKNVTQAETIRMCDWNDQKHWIFFGTTQNQETKLDLKLVKIGRSVTYMRTEEYENNFENSLKKLLISKSESLEGIVFISDDQVPLKLSSSSFLTICKAVGNSQIKRKATPFKLILFSNNLPSAKSDASCPSPSS